MKKIFGIIVAIVLTASIVNAEDSEAKKLCDAEIKKEVINISIVKEQCIKAARFAEEEKNYATASWYYILSDKGIYTFELVKKYNKREKDILYHQDLGFAYLINNKIN